MRGPRHRAERPRRDVETLRVSGSQATQLSQYGQRPLPPLDPGTGSRPYLACMNAGELLIGEVAKRTGVSVDTVRHYERKGLLHEVRRDVNGYRVYPGDVIERIGVIRRAL